MMRNCIVRLLIFNQTAMQYLLYMVKSLLTQSWKHIIV